MGQNWQLALAPGECAGIVRPPKALFGVFDMSRNHITTAITVASAAFALSFSNASAQQMPGGPGGGAGGPGGPGGMQGPRSVEPEGVAEQAPKKLGALPSTPVLPPPKDSHKQLRVFSMDGYFRLRTDWMKQLDLGFDGNTDVGGSPFPNPLACRSASAASACENSFGGANMRLRLEPIIHLDERSTVHMQIDVLDNVVLGSTNQNYRGGGDLPVGAFSGNQAPPQAGVNNLGDSIVVKRAWAEIDAAFGVLKFGRMPWHWGMGVVANAGGMDPIHGGYNLDADYGDSVDRLSFSTAIPGTSLNAELGIDWAQNGTTSSQAGEDVGRGRQSFDLDDADDLDQWLFTISHMDSPTRIANMLADGESVLNYGAFLAYRTQDYEQRGVAFGQTPDPADFRERDMTVYVPDLWLHFAKGGFDFEAEGVAVFGSLKAPEVTTNTVDLRQFGGVARTTYKMLDDDLTLGFEAGFASGDQQKNAIPGSIHVDGAAGIVPGDNTLNRFIFDRDYQVDMILFRELMGAVSNATYAKPTVNYKLTSKFNVRVASILSMAHKKAATPGDSRYYGVELDADIGYSNDGFFAGISYGVLFPFAGLGHSGAAGSGFADSNDGEADTAQTVQTRFVLQF